MTDAERRIFIDQVTPSALAARDEWGVLASLAVAQACLESGFGAHVPAPFNVLGLKDLQFDAGAVTAKTVEDPLRVGPAVPAAFEDFRDYTHCFLAYGRLLARSPSYGSYRAALPDVTNSARALQGIYSADARYAEKLMIIWEKHRLADIDALP